MEVQLGTYCRRAIAVVGNARLDVHIEMFDVFDQRDGRTTVRGRLWYEDDSTPYLQWLEDGALIRLVMIDQTELQLRIVIDSSYPLGDGVVSVVDARSIRVDVE
jgi:hypothetical protein